jgi:hypothetical protein
MPKVKKRQICPQEEEEVMPKGEEQIKKIELLTHEVRRLPFLPNHTGEQPH